jgi:hypothetical protein
LAAYALRLGADWKVTSKNNAASKFMQFRTGKQDTIVESREGDKNAFVSIRLYAKAMRQQRFIGTYSYDAFKAPRSHGL